MLPEEEFSANASTVASGAFARSLQNGTLNSQAIASSFSFRPKVLSSGIYLGHHPSMQVDLRRINRVIGKIVRGFYYFKNKSPLPSSHVVAVWEGNSFWNECESIVGEMNEFAGLGDNDFQASFLRDSVDPDCTFHLYVIYGKLGFFAATLPANDFGVAPSSTTFDVTYPLQMKR